MNFRSVKIMPVLPPELPAGLVDMYLDKAVEYALESGEDVEKGRFYGEALPSVPETVDFRGCRFDKCDLSALNDSRVSFVDCVLDHCDLSGTVLLRCTLQRVKLINCRLTGIRFSEGTLMNVLFEDCQMDYCSFDKEKVQHVSIKRCTMKESIFVECKWQNFELEDCDVDGSEWSRTPLKGLDLTKSRFTYLRVDPAALRGMKVTSLQAMALSRLLGLVIAD